MTNNITVFENIEFGKVITITDENNATWFLGKEVAAILSYSDLNKAVATHVDKEDKIVLKKAIFHDNSKMGVNGIWTNPMDLKPKTFINESGLYSLVLSSKLPSTKKFK